MEFVRGLLKTDVGVGEANVLQERVVFLADPGFLVVAGHVVPVDAVVVELIEHGQAVFGCAVLDGLAVVGLRFANAAENNPRVRSTTIYWGKQQVKYK